MDPNLQAILDDMEIAGASQRQIDEAIQRYNAGLPIYGQSGIGVRGIGAEQQIREQRRRNPFLNILGEIGDWTGLTKQNLAGGWRSGYEGRAKMYDETKDVFQRGEGMTDAELQEWIGLVKKSEDLSQIDSYQKWSDVYDDYIARGENHATATVMATKQEGTAGLLAIMLQSFGGLMNKEIAAVGLKTGLPAAGAAGVTSFGVGALPAGLASFFGGANAAAETMITFTGLLQEELENQDLDFTPDNIRRVLSDDKTKKKIRNKSLGRGVTIGVVV